MNSPTYIFSSQRLGFRTWRESDIPAMCEISSDPKAMEYFPSTQSFDHTRRFVHEMTTHYDKYGYCYYAVDEISSGKFMGFIGMKWVELDFDSFTDIGWRLAPSFWGQGLATEGALCCLNYGLIDLGLERICAIAPQVNTPSIHVMKKAGMRFVRTFEHPLLSDNERLSTCVLYEKVN